MDVTRNVIVLASAGYDRSVRLWDAIRGVCVGILQQSESHVSSLALSRDKRLLAVGGYSSARIYDVGSILCGIIPEAEGSHVGEEGQVQPMHILEAGRGNVVAIGFLGDDGKRIWSASEDGSLLIWDRHAMLQSAEAGPILEVDLLTSGANQYSKDEYLVSLTAVAISESASQIVSADDRGRVREWSIRGPLSLAESVSLRGEHIAIEAQSSPSIIISATRDNAKAAPGCQMGQEKPRGGWPIPVPIRSVAISLDGSQIAAVDDRGFAHIWKSAGYSLSVQRAQTVHAHPGGRGLRCAFGRRTLISDEGSDSETNVLLTTGSDGMARLWAVVPSDSSRSHGEPSSSEANNDSEEQYSRLELLRVLQGHSRWVWDGCFSADGAYVATASSDGTLRLWNAVSGSTITLLEGHLKAAVCVVLNDRLL